MLNNELEKEIGIKLKELRKKEGLSLRGLQNKSGINYCSIFNFEAGKSSISVKQLDALTSALHISLKDFLKDIC